MRPEYPNNIGKKRRLTGINGDRRIFVIQDEIRHCPKSNSDKVIYLQKMKFGDSRHSELRFGYYMLGKKPGRMCGRWVWGQFSLQISSSDLCAVLNKAKTKGWI